MRFVLLHYHILKNAGTTIENILESNLGERFCRFDSSDPNGHISESDLLSFLRSKSHLKALSSHQIHYPRPAAPDFIFFDVCFLRDPLDRIRSMYDYFRQKPAPGDPVSALANELGIGEFARRLITDFPQHVNNAQVVFLANGGVYDHPPGHGDLTLAMERASKASFLGVVDRFEESLVAGQYFLNPVFPDLRCAHMPANVSCAGGGTLAARLKQFRAACEPRVYSELVSLNELDRVLVEQARLEVRRRFDLVPGRALRLRALQEQNRHLAAMRGKGQPAVAAPDWWGLPSALSSFMWRASHSGH